MYITDIVYLLDVLVVIVYMSYYNCWDYLLLHAYEDWGECSEDWAGRAGGGGEVEFLTENKISANKCSFFSGGGGNFGVFGAPHAPTRGARGVGKRYTSSYDHDM